MLDLPAFCCYYKVVTHSTFVLLVLCCREPGQGCQELFVVLTLHKERQTYSSSPGIKHARKGNAACKDIFGNESPTRRGLWEAAPDLSGSWEQLKPQSKRGEGIHKKLLPVTPSTSNRVLVKLGMSLLCLRNTQSPSLARLQ